MAPLIGAARLGSRCWTLYFAYLVVFFIVAAAVSFMSIEFENPLYLEYVNFVPFIVETEHAIIRAVTLSYLPMHLDILPLYIVLLAIAMVALPLMRRSVSGVVLASFIVYLLAGQYNINLPNHPHGTWFFNPFAWQFPFIAAAALAYLHEFHRTDDVV